MINVFANGAGVRYQKYGATFEHLASWGFVAMSNRYSLANSFR